MKRTLDEKCNDNFQNHFKSKKINCPHFAVSPLSQFNAPFPYLRKPKEIGAFSQTVHRLFKHDRSQLKFFRPPSQWTDLAFCLREGYKTFDKKDEVSINLLDDMLKWVQLNKDQFVVQGREPGGESNCIHTDFVCWRGLVTRLLCTPYESRDDWKIAVSLHKGTYYLCEFSTEQKLKQQGEQTERQAEMAYWGLKFEQYVTADTVDGKPDTSPPVNNKAGFCSVVRTRLNKHSLVFGGEVDCCEKEDGAWKYVELKTSREIYHHRQDTNFRRFKLIKWWAQSFLIGIEKIVCGFRDDNGVVGRMEAFPIQKIPKLCAEIPNPWEPSVCFNFLDHFLQYVKDTVKKDDPRVACVFTWEPGHSVRCEEHPAGSEYTFLPEWYYRTSTDDINTVTLADSGAPGT